MDYLVCEDNNAELLQFFIWFCHYVERWSELSTREKNTSPPWKHTEPVERSRTNLSVIHHRRGGSDRLEQILEILDRCSANGTTSLAQEEDHNKISPMARNFSTPRRFSGTQTSQLQIARRESLGKQVAMIENTAESLGMSTVFVYRRSIPRG